MYTERYSSAFLARAAALGFTLLMGFGAFTLFLNGQNSLAPLEWLRAILIVIATLWIAWGASLSLLGLLPAKRNDCTSAFSRHKVPTDQTPTASNTNDRLAVLIPICDEDPLAVFARIAAMDESLVAEGLRERVDFAVLSDTRNKAGAALERLWFSRLLRERSAEGRLFYRRRLKRHGRKAGNISNFITRSGGAYTYALILDADSLMEGSTIAEMLRRMEADASLGLLQSLPCVIGARSVFGRAMQFAASLYSPVFARGVARMQGRSGPFWGHNAMIRVRAFAESCGLPELAGSPPFGGHILSHDYVEAALLARKGWTVRLDSDLYGSYEEGPENIMAFARRDRRWCQGNLQHVRLLLTPGLTTWSRFVLLQGIIAYVASLLWGTFLLSSVLAIATVASPNYFPDAHQLFPVFPDERTTQIIGLAIGIVGLLILPKLLIALNAVLNGRAKSHGGNVKIILSTVTELLLSSLTAPILLMYQSRAVIEVLCGSDGGWPASQRGEGRLRISEAWAASNWIALSGSVALLALWHFVPDLFVWMLPIGLPMVFAPLIMYLTSQTSHSKLFLAAMELQPTAVILAYQACLVRWNNCADTSMPFTEKLPGHVSA